MSRSDMLPLWTDAYLADTMHLSNEHHGCYLKLLIFAWRQHDCRIKDCNLVLKNVLGVTPKKLSTLKPVLMEFWELKDGYYSQKRLAKEHKKRRDYIKSKKPKSLEDENFDDAKSSETLPKKPNENNERQKVAETVAVADLNSCFLGAQGDWKKVREVCIARASMVLAADCLNMIPIQPIMNLLKDPKHPCSFEDDIIPAIDEVVARGSPDNMRHFNYIAKVAIGYRDRRLAGSPAPQEIQNAKPSYQNKSRSQQNGEQRSAEIDAAFGLALSQPQQR